MEPDEPIDLAALDPSRDAARWEHAITGVAARGRERYLARRALVRRGAVAVVLAAAAALAVWLGAPGQGEAPRRDGDILEWATREVGASDVLVIGATGGHDAR